MSILFILDEYTCIYTYALASIFIRICIFHSMRVCICMLLFNTMRFTITLSFFFFYFSSFFLSFFYFIRLKRNRLTCNNVLLRPRALTLVRRSWRHLRSKRVSDILKIGDNWKHCCKGKLIMKNIIIIIIRFFRESFYHWKIVEKMIRGHICLKI